MGWREMTALEDLQHLEQQTNHVVDLLNQAEIALEQVHVICEQIQPNHANPHVLIEAIYAVRYDLHAVTDRHNEFLARLQEAQQHEHEGQVSP
jgi:hypothetical protein